MVPVECTDELPAPKLRSSIGVNHTAGHHATAGDANHRQRNGTAIGSVPKDSIVNNPSASNATTFANDGESASSQSTDVVVGELASSTRVHRTASVGECRPELTPSVKTPGGMVVGGEHAASAATPSISARTGPPPAMVW